ncbi:MAG: DUF192 domain-containing protein [Pseudomonadota bacterium]
MKSIFLTFLAALFVWGCQPDASAAGLMRDTLLIETQDGQTHEFEVEIALTPPQIQRGLMGRTSLDANAGMLFWFGGEESERSFWMKNTLIPLDMLFIKKDGTIHRIHHKAIPHDLTSVASQGPVAAVLEINGGRAQELGLEAGDRIKQRFFK